MQSLQESFNQDIWYNPVHTGIITSIFGERLNPILGISEFHNGIDIAIDENTQVYSVKSGTILEIGESSTYGIYLKYITEDNFTIMYAHLNKVLVNEGDNIKEKQVIALSGNTGLSTGAHLHYSIWQGDTLIDPLNFINDLPYSEEVLAEISK